MLLKLFLRVICFWSPPERDDVSSHLSDQKDVHGVAQGEAKGSNLGTAPRKPTWGFRESALGSPEDEQLQQPRPGIWGAVQPKVGGQDAWCTILHSSLAQECQNLWVGKKVHGGICISDSSLPLLCFSGWEAWRGHYKVSISRGKGEDTEYVFLRTEMP